MHGCEGDSHIQQLDIFILWSDSCRKLVNPGQTARAVNKRTEHISHFIRSHANLEE